MTTSEAAVPDVAVPDAIPKTRSDRIMRRLAPLGQGEELGDITSLQNPWAVDDIRAVLAAGVAERKAGR